jgi:hypothetical protein
MLRITAWMANLLKQLLQAQFGEGTSSQQPIILQPPITSVIPNSQNLGQIPQLNNKHFDGLPITLS